LLERVVRVVGTVLALLVAMELTLVECYLVPLRIGSVPLPVSIPLAVVGNVLAARLTARISGVRALAALPSVLWLVTVLVLAAPRAEGDLVVPGSLTGLVFLFAGSVAGAYGAATAPTRRRPPPPDRPAPAARG
jgi:hypothetical protein